MNIYKFLAATVLTVCNSYFDTWTFDEECMCDCIEMCMSWLDKTKSLKKLNGNSWISTQTRMQIQIHKLQYSTLHKHICALQVFHSSHIAVQICCTKYEWKGFWVGSHPVKRIPPPITGASEVTRNRCAESCCQNSSTSLQFISASTRPCHLFYWCQSSQSSGSTALKSPTPLPLRPSRFPFLWGAWTEGEEAVEEGSCSAWRERSSLKTESIWRQTSWEME